MVQIDGWLDRVCGHIGGRGVDIVLDVVGGTGSPSPCAPSPCATDTSSPTDIKQPKALVTVAEAGGVLPASELLHLVQSAVARQIHTLKNELGTALFERARSGGRPK
ncbi:hypothetical protein AQJ46_47785 [Streptomyces canus]|uniref:HTH lysR-type domain-containing protein n=1 Tax=Streptomyces canus TaxID=58343 RepID=A0A101RKX1_9ACTN|nr:LysR family transcriptional regulator [Streptomyces canus]KUN57441.1 hypothetical protein AQJ46_47785 [Streptomyces canus]